MKTVWDKDLKKVIDIDETMEKDWKKKYWHRSGVPFGADVGEVIGDEDMERELKILRRRYMDKFGKKCSPSKLNDLVYLREKVKE